MVWTVFYYISKRAQRVTAAVLSLALVHVALAGLVPHDGASTCPAVSAHIDIVH